VSVQVPVDFRNYFSSLNDQLPSITVSTNDAKWAPPANWPEYLTKLVDRATYLSEVALSLQNVIAMANDGQISPHILPSEVLKAIITEIRKGYNFELTETADEDVLRTYIFPMTFITHKPKVTSGKEDSLSYVYVFYFVTPTYNRFEYNTLRSLPIPTNKDEVWRTYVPPQKYFLVNSGQKWATDKDSYTCIEDPTTDVVSICFFIDEYPSQALDECSQAIFQKTAVDTVCPYKEMKGMHHKAIMLQPNTWAYSISEASSVLEQCPTKQDKTTILGDVGILELKTTCKYHFTSSPFQGVMPVTLFNHYEVHIGKVLPYKPHTAHPIQEHFKIYGYIYILVLFGIIFTLISLAVVLYVYFRMKRVTRQNATVRYNRPTPNDEDLEIGRATAGIFLNEISRPRPYLLPLCGV
jgi:hypothetical protein